MFLIIFYWLEDYLLFHKEITKQREWEKGMQERLTSRNGVIWSPLSIFKG